ncbi:MAG TPA: hypothetical protein VH247_01800 [Thermoleophilaceae bacterium]|nr:hypothetical protein [Thermoleophilaceae bacterium]
MSAHSASHRRGWLSALVAQVSDYVFEEVGETVEQPKELVAHPVVAVVAAAPRAGASTVGRLLAAELATRADGAAIVVAAGPSRRAAPPSRAAIRLATAMAGLADAQPVGRLCIARVPAGSESAARSESAADGASARAGIVNAARYLAPVVLDLPADGSAAGIRRVADRIAIVGAGSGEPALLSAVAAVIGGHPVKVVTRVGDPADWQQRADILLPDSRIAARAASLGTRALGSVGSGIAALADALEAGQ